MELNTLSLQDQRVQEHLENSWQSFEEISPKMFTEISTFALSMPEPYKKAAFHMLAKHMVSMMNLHLLSLMATFQNKAEQENILAEDREELFQKVFPETFGTLEKLNKHIAVNSLDDLTALSCVTNSLRTLSQANSAETAEGWLYELPSMYYRQINGEQLLAA